ncbi:hypothetical protein KSS87_012128 [Heliosperma pusillum]|nr:hypothetical protein KSS87_012128 [Heliosperma pusillum]
MASSDVMGKSDIGQVVTVSDIPKNVVEAAGVKEVQRVNEKEVAEVSQAVVEEETKDPVVAVELDPEVVFGREEGDVWYTDFELARKDMINTNRMGYRGWKDAYLNADGDYVRLNCHGEEVEYDGSLDTDSNWNRQFWSSSDDDEDEVSSRPKRELSLKLMVLSLERIENGRRSSLELCSKTRRLCIPKLIRSLNDAINTIIRRDENTETGQFLQPYIEGKLLSVFDCVLMMLAVHLDLSLYRIRDNVGERYSKVLGRALQLLLEFNTVFGNVKV